LAVSNKNYPIFPELTPRAEIFDKINLLEKASLEDAIFSYPEHVASLLENIVFLKISGTPAQFDFQQHKIMADDMALNILAAMNHLFFPLIYVINGCNGGIQVYMGTNKAGMPSLVSLLQAGIGPSLLEAMELPPSFPSEKYSNCAALTGIPHVEERKMASQGKTTPEKTTIDQLISALRQEEWMYVVQAFPVKRQQTNFWFESCGREIKETKETFLLRDGQKTNRMAAYYIEILEKTINRFKEAKQQGLWQTGVYFFTPSKEILNRGTALLCAIFTGDRSVPESIRCHVCQPGGGVSPLINGYHSRELKAFISLPTREYHGFRLREKISFDVDFSWEAQKSIIIGKIVDEQEMTDMTCAVPVNDLAKHGLAAGVTGSGKTNSIFQILKQLYKDHRIPFLVIEPAKAEYRQLLAEIPDLLVFTLGEERPEVSAPFRMNPLAFPPGISLQTHIDYLKAVFNASFVMYAPMPYVLEECIHRVYEDKGWNLVTSENFRGRSAYAYPTLSDLYAKIEEVVENIGYEDRTTMDIKAALETRIKNLCLGAKGLMLNSRTSISFSDIMKIPVVMELKYMGSDEEKTFLMGLILMGLYEYYESMSHEGGNAQQADPGLQHLTVIEEAHRLLKNVPTEKSSEDQSNIRGKGVETFCNILAEIRAYGEGVLVSEQIPVKLAPDVIKNTNLKLMHRIVSKDDRDCLGDAMNLHEGQKRKVVSLSPGEAVFFREGIDRPLLVKIPLSREKEQTQAVANSIIASIMGERFYQHNPSLLQKYPACIFCPNIDKRVCEFIKKEVEDIIGAIHLQRVGVKLFLPYLFNPERGEVWNHFESLIPVRENQRYCFAAHMSWHYLQMKGNALQWPFSRVERLLKGCHEKIISGEFARQLGKSLQDQSTQLKAPFIVCEPYCRRMCLLSYEGRCLDMDPLLHDRVFDVLHSEERGSPYFEALIRVIRYHLDEYLPDDLQDQWPSLGICLLINKLNRLGFSLAAQRDILQGFTVMMTLRDAQID